MRPGETPRPAAGAGRRRLPGGTPKARLKALQKAASDR